MPDWRETHNETMLQHLGEEEHILGAVVPPVFQNSLYIYETWEEFKEAAAGQFDLSTSKEKCFYSRINNPSLDLIGEKIAALEKTERARFFASGMAAIAAAIMACTKTGSHIVCVDTCYGPTRSFLTDYLPRFGVDTTFVVGTEPQEIIDAIRPETSLIFLESPGSILFLLQDLETVATEARKRGIRTAIDNSYASPLLQNPVDFGIDIVIHTASKYLGGHSDLIAGVVATSDEIMREMMENEIQYFGASLAPWQSAMILRSLRTLNLRIKQHSESASTVAHWLRDRPEIANVHYVGFEDFPQRELFLKQMKGAGSLISFEPVVQDEASIAKFAEALRVFRMGVGWGGHESLCVPMQYQPINWPEQKWIVRLHCGLEHADDLIADLDQAIKAAQ